MINISTNDDFFLNNKVDFCVGTGRMGLALQKEYTDQLRFVQEHIGFSHIRGHGLFSDDMAIYHEYEEDGRLKVEYNFTYLDLVMDSYRELGLKPFLELGFMPGKLASGEQTVFYWKGNVTPPKDYKLWTDLVTATLGHLIDRYGEEEVLTWPIEVWNEPNLRVFWKDADMQEYFKLFEMTFKAIKAFNPGFKVGGPAVCGGSDEVWISAFMDFVEERGLDIDYVTRHHYTTELPVRSGHYGYPPLSVAEDGFMNLGTTRAIIDSHVKYKGLPIHVTENNTSYIPNAPLHDTARNAAYMAEQLSRLGDVNESYSYWTFGDIFEEQGVPFTPFHGGFGLVANGSIPKPTFWTFKFYKEIKDGRCIYKDANNVVVIRDDGSITGISWNYTLTGETDTREFVFEIDKKLPAYCLVTETIDSEHGNPLKVWHDLGEPSSLSAWQKEIILRSAVPYVKTEHFETEGNIKFKIRTASNGVTKWDIRPADIRSDRGYDYERVIRGEEFIESEETT